MQFRWTIIIKFGLVAVFGALGWIATGQAAVHELAAIRAQNETLRQDNARLQSELTAARHDVDTLRSEERSSRDGMQTCRESLLHAEATAATVPALQSQATQCEAEVAAWREEGGLARVITDLQKQEAHLTDQLAFRLISYSKDPVPESPQQHEEQVRRDVIDQRINLLISSRACQAQAR